MAGEEPGARLARPCRGAMPSGPYCAGMLVRLASLQDRLRKSLFLVPMLFVVGGAALAELTLLLDDRVDILPTRLTATVDSARSVLSVVAGATLAFAGIAFSVSLLLISLASSQYSPRVVHGLFRDPFNKRVMGVVVGTFTYCLVVLRAVRGPLEESGTPVIPSVSVLIAVLLGVISILAIVAFISHSAHARWTCRRSCTVSPRSRSNRSARPGRDETPRATTSPTSPSPPATATPSRSTARLGATDRSRGAARRARARERACDSTRRRDATRFRTRRSCTIWPDTGRRRGRPRRRSAPPSIIGESRTMQQDVTYGVRQLADVALKALSPGINDPTTAQDALFHLGAVVQEMLGSATAPRDAWSAPNASSCCARRRCSHEEVIDLAFDEVRIAAVGQPTVQIYLLEILHLLALSRRNRSNHQSGARPTGRPRPSNRPARGTPQCRPRTRPSCP